MPTKTRRVFTPALEAARDELLKYLEAFCFLVISHDGHWGRSDTIKKAARVCIKAGAQRSTLASVLIVLGDETAEVNGAGYSIRDAGSQSVKLFERIKLSSLTNRL